MLGRIPASGVPLRPRASPPAPSPASSPTRAAAGRRRGVIAIHVPSGTNYEAKTRADGRFVMPGMRVGGPVLGHGHLRGAGTAFQPETQDIVRSTSVSRPDLPVHRPRHCRAGDGHRDGAVGPGLQLGAHRRGDIGQPRRHREAADDLRPHQRPHAADAAGERQLVRRPGQPAEQHHGGRLVLQQLVRAGEGSRASVPASRRSRWSRSNRCRSASRRSTCARATSSAPPSTRSRAAAPTSSRGSFYHRFRNEDFVGTEARGADGQPRHLHVPRHRRVGAAVRSSRTSCSSSATTRTRRRAAAAHVPRQHRRPASRRQRHARAGVGPRHAQRLSQDRTSTTTPAATRTCDDDAGEALPVQDRLQPEQQQQDQLPLQPARLELGQHPVGLDVGGPRPRRPSARAS